MSKSESGTPIPRLKPTCIKSMYKDGGTNNINYVNKQNTVKMFLVDVKVKKSYNLHKFCRINKKCKPGLQNLDILIVKF